MILKWTTGEEEQQDVSELIDRYGYWQEEGALEAQVSKLERVLALNIKVLELMLSKGLITEAEVVDILKEYVVEMGADNFKIVRDES